MSGESIQMMTMNRCISSPLFALCLALLCALAGACTPSSAPKEGAPGVQLTFVRAGLMIEGTAGQAEILQNGQRIGSRRIDLDNRRQLLVFDWTPGAAYSVQVGGQDRPIAAPERPTPYRIRTVALAGDAVGASSAIPDVDLKFSPDGTRLAIGTLFGQLLCIETYTGKVLLDQKVAEGMVKRVAFSPDGQTLYAGEQSPDGFLMAYDVRSAALQWKKRLADDLESSSPPSAQDRYAVYFLPGVFDLRVLADGRIVVAGTHSWNVEGVQKNRSRIYVYRPDGTLDWQFPEDKPLDATVITFDVDVAGEHLVFALGRSATTPPTGPITKPGIYALNLKTRSRTWSHTFSPLLPHFKDVFVWEALTISPDGSRALVGLGDGRAAIFDATAPGPDAKLLKLLELGTPIDVSGVPIATPVSYARATTRDTGTTLYAQTNNSNIPFGTEASSRTPPAPHPAARTLFAIDSAGEIQWRYRGDFTPSGIWASRDGKVVMMTSATPSNSTEGDRNGLVLLDATREGPADARLVYRYQTEGPVFFHADISPNGQALAIAETPARRPDGQTVYGTWQVHVVQ